MELKLQVLPPESVNRNWTTLSWYIMQALPPTSYEHPMRNGNILKAVLKGDLVVYSLTGDDVILFIASVKYFTDEVTGDRVGMIFSATALQTLALSKQKEGLDLLLQAIKTTGCNRVVAYAETEVLSNWHKSAGAKVSYVSTWEI